MNIPQLAIVIPCYNEEEVLLDTVSQMTLKMTELINNNLIKDNSYMLLIDDGSKDKTWYIIENTIKINPLVKGLKLSKNFGHQNALISGLEEVTNNCDISVSIDADLQDDINVIDKFIEKYKEGFEIVLGVRNNREVDSFFKKFTAEGYYKVMNMMGVKTVYNHADFRLMSNKALIELNKFQEKELFLRGMVGLIGLKTCTVEYKRLDRLKGTTKYSLSKMLKLAWTGITSFTSFPLRLVTVMGLIIFIGSLLSIVGILIAKWFGYTVQGWSSILISIFFLGGLQILAIGIIGEYIAKIYTEIKNRPRYIVEKKSGFEDKDKNE